MQVGTISVPIPFRSVAEFAFTLRTAVQPHLVGALKGSDVSGVRVDDADGPSLVSLSIRLSDGRLATVTVQAWSEDGGYLSMFGEEVMSLSSIAQVAAVAAVQVADYLRKALRTGHDVGSLTEDHVVAHIS